MHRGNMEDAGKLLVEAESIAKGALPTLNQYPAMRQGSFLFAMEEVSSRQPAKWLCNARERSPCTERSIRTPSGDIT